jgi:hypothetical protein
VQLASPFAELAMWISETWSVTVLNVIYDGRNDLHALRIQIILEYDVDTQSFRDGLNFDQKKQKAIASQFLKIISRQANHGYDVDRLFVVFSSFAPIALEEADARISDKEIKALKRRIANPHLWEISRCFGHVTFVFYKDAQVNS